MASCSIRTILAGAAALLASVALPALGHAETVPYPIDLSSAFGNQSFGTVNVTQLTSQELSIAISINSGFQLTDGGLGSIIAFKTDEAVHFDAPGGWSPVGNGKNGGIHMGAAGTFGGGLDHSGNSLGQNLTFDIFVTGTKTLSISDLIQNKAGNFFAVDLVTSVNHDGDKDRDDRKQFVAWANDPPRATPIPGALALFAPVLGAGYMALRRRRRTDRDVAG